MHTRDAVTADAPVLRAPRVAQGWSRVEWFCAALTLLAPFTAYAFSASGSTYWLDSGEFTAAARELDIAHPPGHPLASLWGGLFALLPLGPLAYRVALAQGVAAAIGLLALARGTTHGLRALALGRDAAAGTATAFALSFGASYACWFQAIRAEVYTLQMMLVCIAFERVAAACARRQEQATWSEWELPLYCACFALGLGLTNHHLIAFLAVPALLVPWWGEGTLRGLARRTCLCMASAAVGLSVYAYLPLRAATPLRMNLGTPNDWQRFWWVVSARVYARNMGTGESEPLGTRLFDVLVILVEQLTLPVLLLALLGSYAGLRHKRMRTATIGWCSAFIVNLGVRAWLGPIRGNPDMLGYMLPGMAALSALAAFGFAALLDSVLRALHGRHVPSWCAVALPCLVLVRYGSAYASTNLAHFDVTDSLTELRLRSLPSRAVLILSTPQAVFLHWAAEASEHLRPDVSMVPLPFLGYPGVADALMARDPSLRAVVEPYLAEGALRLDALQTLAQERPVHLELDANETLALYPFTAPHHAYARVVSRPPTPAELGATDSAGSAALAVLAKEAHIPSADETRHQMLWLEYIAALRMAAGGASAEARAHVARALILNPQSQELRTLADALSRTSLALPLQAFLPRASGALAR